MLLVFGCLILFTSTGQVIGWEDLVYAPVKWWARKIVSKMMYIVHWVWNYSLLYLSCQSKRTLRSGFVNIVMWLYVYVLSLIVSWWAYWRKRDYCRHGRNASIKSGSTNRQRQSCSRSRRQCRPSECRTTSTWERYYIVVDSQALMKSCR